RDDAGVTAAAAIAAAAEGHGEGLTGAGRNCETAIAAAAADRLCENAVGRQSIGLKQTLGRFHGYRACGAAIATVAAKCEGEVTGPGRDGEAAITTASPHRLREYRIAVVACRRNVIGRRVRGHQNLDLAAYAAIAAR